MADDLDKRIANLKRSMSSGVLRVESADTGSATYRGYDEMRQALSDLERQKAAQEAAAGGRRRTRQIVTTSRSGW
ncbi:hypothetical protein [Methylobacterium sp. Leaf93]|uniref:phage head-tail joining protein n=1 Tax=Methylobacterium sp. Leaf93 TaxID=1736249 RepID=UPI0006F986E7|nr:hypothetical protein [Methylobacterium sp. Leaf93]KQP02650.1 hypothetical protein ASF26_14570 [Methylobacterium sp. Leaf93]